LERPVVLFSDDDPTVLHVVEAQGSRAGLWVLSDPNSNAVDLARRILPDLIVLDVKQRVGGLQLLERLKAHPETASIDVVMISSVDDEPMRKACEALGAELMLKPITTSTILEVAQRAGSAQRKRLRKGAQRYRA
jgi:CheY-like chemotaxis protein